jgi:hypothetical protein
MQHTAETPKQYQCRHIFTEGRRCASPCLRGEELCYYHHTTRKPVANPRQRRRRHSTFHLPLPDPNDRSGIQIAIGEVLQRIAANDIDPRRAGLLLYGLQIASLNLPKPQPTHRNAKPGPVETAQTVEEITIDPTFGVLAPRAEVSEPAQRKSVVAQLIERILQTEKEEDQAANPGINEGAARPVTLPTLQATADSTAPPSPSFKATQRRNLLSPLLKNRTTEKLIPRLCRCPFSSTQPKNRHFDRSAAQWRNPLFDLNWPFLCLSSRNAARR